MDQTPENAEESVATYPLDRPQYSEFGLRSAALADRLDAMRRRARWLLVFYGSALLLLCALASLMALIVLDWFFWFPQVIRFSFGMAWIIAVAWVIAKHVAPPILSNFTMVHVAAKIEERFPEFQDRLTSSLSFIAEGTVSRDPLQQKLVDRTADIAQDVPMEQAISTQPTWRMAALSFLSLLLMISVGLSNPHWMGMGLQRFIFPFLPLDWPKTVNIQPLTHDMTIAQGESVVLSMEITRGQTESLRGFLYAAPRGERTNKQVMRREGESRYAWTFNAVTGDLTYWFEAGDDSTKSSPGMIRVVERPAVEDLRLSVEPPPYISNKLPVSLTDSTLVKDQSVDLIEGSRLTIKFHSSKPLGRDDAGRLKAWLATDSGEKIYALASDESVGNFAVQVVPRDDQEYRIRLVDTDGFENGNEGLISVSVRKDAPPTLVIQKPVEVLEITPQATVKIVGEARDDLGIHRIRLTGMVRRLNTPFEFDITGWVCLSDRSGRAVAPFEHSWPLTGVESVKGLPLKVGDSVEYMLWVEDNRMLADLEPQTGHSYRMLLKVVGELQFTSGIADEINRLARRLRRYLPQQVQLLDDTESIHEVLETAPDHDPDGELLRLSTRQRNLAGRIAGIRIYGEELVEQLVLNGIERGRERQQADLFAQQLRSLVEPAMQEAAIKLNASRGRIDVSEQLTDISQAGDLEQAALEAIRNLLNELTVWDDYQGVVANMRELIDLQQQVSQQTALLQEKTLGQTIESLSEALGEEIERTALNQQRVTTALERALVKLGDMQAKLRFSDPDNALALADARRKLESDQVSPLSRKAVEEIRANKTGQAQVRQNKIERALAETISRLETRQSRRLAELSKQLGRIEEIILNILNQQKEIQTATQEIKPEDPASVLAALANRQRKLQSNTLQAVDVLNAIPQAGEAAQRTRLAAQEMARAADALYKGIAEAARESQTWAVDHLEKVLALLQELRENTEKAIQKQNLFAIKRFLLSIRKRQSQVNQETNKLLRRLNQSGRLTRTTVRRAKKQARVQRAIETELATVEEKLTFAPVYLWVVKRILDAMTTSEELLRQAQMDDALFRVQKRAIAFLDQLIDAIRQCESMVDEQFAEGSGMGGAGGQLPTGKQRPVPTVAELIVLKGIQRDINQRTKELFGSMEVDSPSEAQLQEAQILGEDQAQLKNLTQELTQKSRQAH